MLEISYIRENHAAVLQGLKKKRLAQATELLDEVLDVDQRRRTLQVERDQALAQANAFAKEIGQLMKAGKKEDATAVREQAAALKERTKDLSDEVNALETRLTTLLYQLPNVPHESVPEGNTPDDNVVVREFGEVPQFAFEPLPHWDLAAKYDLIDFEVGSKVTGAGFPFYKGKGARLQRAMINFFLEEAVKAGYLEVQAPLLVNEASGYGTGQLPDKEGQMYQVVEPNYYLIPTAEVPLTNMLRDEIIDANKLPIKLAGYTPCFRMEAGSWGAHVRGLNRLHQFDKVEIVQVCLPENSYEIHEEMCLHVQGLLEKLELPYRKLLLCGGDISFNAALCYDMEVYSAAQQRWLEVSSISNFESFQANRLKLRYREAGDKKPILAHTLNGSALALPRILAAILENNQTPSGIRIPEVLQPYCGFDHIGQI